MLSHQTPKRRRPGPSRRTRRAGAAATGCAAEPAPRAARRACPILRRFVDAYMAGLDGERRCEVVARLPPVAAAPSNRADRRWRLRRCREQHAALVGDSRADRVFLRLLGRHAVDVCAAAFLLTERHDEALRFLDDLASGPSVGGTER